MMMMRIRCDNTDLRLLKVLIILFTLATNVPCLALSVTSRSLLVRDLQTCFTPDKVIDRVSQEPSFFFTKDQNENLLSMEQALEKSELARLILVRLSKQWIAIDNRARYYQEHDNSRRLLRDDDEWWVDHPTTSKEKMAVVQSVVETLIQSTTRILSGHKQQISCESLVEGTKALSVISRLVPYCSTSKIVSFWDQYADIIVPFLMEHEISGTHWALRTLLLNRRAGDDNEIDCNQLSADNSKIPLAICQAWNDLQLPFQITPGLLTNLPKLSLSNLKSEVNFKVDEIRTVSNKVVKERRQTAWEGDDGVGPFIYSDKQMARSAWSPTVEQVRDELSDVNGGHGQYYDCCLLNHYPDGGSGMRYHIDPDQGTLWDYDTAVVSVGATRRFSFRKTNNSQNAKRKGNSGGESRPHSFLVLHGDVTHMFGTCQADYQHCVKKAETKSDDAARASLVFKRSWR